jgi:hypothetical protein
MSDPETEDERQQRIERDAASGQFLSGHKGGPGRPKGSKNEFVEDFWKDLRDAWKAHGRDAIKRMIETMPDKFVTVAAGKIPQEVEHTSNTYVIVAPEASTSTQEWLDSLSVRRPDQTIQ